MVAGDTFLSEDDLSSLISFREMAEDGECFSMHGNIVKRLVDIGVIRHAGFGKYCTTQFGDWVIESVFLQNPILPLTSNYGANHDR